MENSANIKLKEPEENDILIKLLKQRHSDRNFIPNKEFSLQEISNIMWVAYGTNRKKMTAEQLMKDPMWLSTGCKKKSITEEELKKEPYNPNRTVGSAWSLYPIELFAFLDKGIYKYDAENNELILIKNGNFKEKSGGQEFVKNSSLNIILAKNKKVYEEVNNPLIQNFLKNNDVGYSFCCLECGLILQNICLYCSLHNIKNCIRGNLGDRIELKNILGLNDNYEILFGISLGY